MLERFVALILFLSDAFQFLFFKNRKRKAFVHLIINSSALITFLFFTHTSQSQTEGTLRYNSGDVEFYDGTQWESTNQGVTANACTQAGEIRYVPASDRSEFCNGSFWVSMDASNDTTVACTDAGALRYNSTNKDVEYCNDATMTWHGTKTSCGDFTDAFTSNDTYTVPSGCTEITVSAWGAGGGGGGGGSSGAGGGGDGGGGGYTQATITVTPGESLNIYVGGAGGGGQDNNTIGSGGGGGGYSGVFRSTTALIVAAGGGGGGGADNFGGGAGRNAGAGGGTTGVDGTDWGGGSTGGDGGTAGAGGAAGAGGTSSPTAGASLAGGNGGGDGGGPTAGAGGTNGGGTGGTGSSNRGSGGGGGAGYYGGGGGGGATSASNAGSGGAGGSSYTTGTSVTNTAGSGTATAGTGDPEYLAPAGVGGAGGADSQPGTDGSAGRVVVITGSGGGGSGGGGGGGGGDPHWANVVLLIQPDTDDTVPEDLSTSAHTVNTANGTAMSTAVTDPFGGSNKVILFDGNDNRLSMPDSDDWILDGDFTVEMWVYYLSNSFGTNNCLVWQRNGVNYFGSCMENDGSVGMELGVYSGGAGYSITEGSNNGAGENAWVHIAYVRSGSDWKIFEDGTEIVSGSSGVAVSDISAAMHLGSDGTTTGWTLDGYIGSARITKGVARYTSNFTPPTEAFPTSAGSTYDTEVVLTSGTSWTVPADWDSADNEISCIGGGGRGEPGDNNGGEREVGGGGGAYAAATNVTLTPSTSVTISIGAGGTSGSQDGEDTYFCNSTSNCADINGSAVVVGAKGGQAGINGGAGGLASASVGDTKYDGGSGGASTDIGGSGGGGAGGPNGAGADGGDTSWDGGSGGGGASGGSVGSNNSGNDGGSGGNNFGSSGGGAGGNSGNGGNGGNGTDGAGGGGALFDSSNNYGGTGGDGTDMTSTQGAGGGGGGGPTDGAGGDGGLYGGGGGAGGDESGTNGGGDGGAGICVVKYNAAGGGGGPTPVHHWEMEETSGTNVVDSIGTNDGTFYGDTNVTSDNSGIRGSALSFDGANDRINISNLPAFETVPFTWSFWVKFDVIPSSGQTAYLIRTEHGSSPWMSYFIWVGNWDDLFEIGIRDSGGTVHWVLADSGTEVVAGEWNNVVMRVDATYQTHLFINGVKQANTTNPGSLMDSTGADFRFGANTESQERLEGSMDEIKFFDSALTDAEIADLYTSTTMGTASNGDPYWDKVVLLIQPDADDTAPEDLSPSAHSPSFNNGATFSTSVSDPFGGSNQVMSFDGDNDRILIADSDDWWLEGDFTLEFWTYFNTMDGNDIVDFLVQYQNGSNNFAMGFHNNTNDGIYVYNSSGVTWSEGSDYVFNTGEWRHIVFQRSGNDFTVYDNGTSIGTYTDSDGYTNNASSLRLIGDGAANQSLDGYIHGIRFTKGVARYTSNFTPPTERFAASSIPAGSAVVGECPAGYVYVPNDGIYTTSDFCVMKYEAKAETNAGGSFDADGLGVALGSYKPASVPNDLPWRSITRDNAQTECQSLGTGYDLISNDQWQTMARNIENVGWNWDNGVVGGGNGLNHGHADVSPSAPIAASTSDDSACINTGQTCDGSTWHVERRTNKLSNGGVIWDLGGNLAEWTSTNSTFNYGAETYMSQVTASFGNTGPLGKPKVAFGPAGDWSSFSTGNRGGLGKAWINYTSGVVFRGGIYNENTEAGIFSAHLYFNGSTTNNDVGFRCVYDPAVGGADPYVGDVVLLIQPEAGDSTIDDYSLSAHTINPQADAALSTAINDPWGTSGKTVIMDGTDDYLDVADSDDWYFDGDFTIEAWLQFNFMNASEEINFFYQWQNGSNNQGYALNHNFDQGWVATGDHSGASFDLAQGQDATLSTGVWYHVTWVRHGNNYLVFQDGVEVMNGTDSTTHVNLASALDIGGTGGATSLDGHLGALRVTKGSARYTSDFVPPTRPFTKPYLAAASVTFDDATNEYMSRTPSSAGDRRTWTMSTWFRRDNTSSGYESIINAHDGSDSFDIGFETSDRIDFWDTDEIATANPVLRTNTTVTDTNWHHLVFVFDTTDSTQADRVRIYLDGTRLTSFAVNNLSTWALNEQGNIMNTANSHRVGMGGMLLDEYYDGRLSEFHFVDGQALSPTDFGYDDGGTWTPKSYLGTYGTNGFYLFGLGTSSLDIGADQSGNGHDFTLQNMDSSNYDSANTPP